jgi:hypothetical protein
MNARQPMEEPPVGTVVLTTTGVYLRRDWGWCSVRHTAEHEWADDSAT